MKWTTILAGFICAIGSVVFAGAVVVSSWRIGVGNWFLVDQPLWLGLNTWQVFAYRYYGPLFIWGAFPQTWGTVGSMVCGQFRAVYGITVAEGLLKTGSFCIGLPGCADSFADHFMMRCEEYNYMSTVGAVVIGFTAFAFVINMATLMTLFLSTLKDTKVVILGLFMLVDCLTISCWVGWVYFSRRTFEKLGSNSTYPFPELASGAFVYLAGVFIHASGTFAFFWYKMGRKYFQKEEDFDPQFTVAAAVISARRASQQAAEQEKLSALPAAGGAMSTDFAAKSQDIFLGNTRGAGPPLRP